MGSERQRSLRAFNTGWLAAFLGGGGGGVMIGDDKITRG